MTDKDYNEMYNEYIKGGKFADYVNKSAKTYDATSDYVGKSRDTVSRVRDKNDNGFCGSRI